MSAGGFAPRPPCLPRQGSLPPDPLPPAAGGEDPCRGRHGGLRAKPPALEIFAFFYKNNLILGLHFLQNNLILGLRPQTQCEFLTTPLLSVLVCYVRILPTSIRTAFFNLLLTFANNIPLQERLFSSCAYQKRKLEIKGKLKMI